MSGLPFFNKLFLGIMLVLQLSSFFFWMLLVL